MLKKYLKIFNSGKSFSCLQSLRHIKVLAVVTINLLKLKAEEELVQKQVRKFVRNLRCLATGLNSLQDEVASITKDELK